MLVDEETEGSVAEVEGDEGYQKHDKGYRQVEITHIVFC